MTSTVLAGLVLLVATGCGQGSRVNHASKGLSKDKVISVHDATDDATDDEAKPSFTGKSAKCTGNDKNLAKGDHDRSTFRCNGGYCIPMKGRCNGIANCGDGSDEKGCDEADPSSTASSASCTVKNLKEGHNDGSTFRCKGGWCVPKKGLCNGVKNCGDNSDEKGCDQACLTTGSGGTAGNGKSCVFPFTYFGVSYSSCTDAHSAAPQGWCYTDVDRAGWGECGVNVGKGDTCGLDALAAKKAEEARLAALKLEQERLAAEAARQAREALAAKKAEELREFTARLVSADKSQTKGAGAGAKSCGKYNLQNIPDKGKWNKKVFRCLGGWCIPLEARCNGGANCGDSSDMLGCAVSKPQCPPGLARGEKNGDTFRCDGGWCIPKEDRCNGVKNCGDGSDEEGCHHGPNKPVVIPVN